MPLGRQPLHLESRQPGSQDTSMLAPDAAGSDSTLRWGFPEIEGAFAERRVAMLGSNIGYRRGSLDQRNEARTASGLSHTLRTTHRTAGRSGGVVPSSHPGDEA